MTSSYEWKYQQKESSVLGECFSNEVVRARANEEFANFSLKVGHLEIQIVLVVCMMQSLESGGHVLVHMHLYFKSWPSKCLDNLLLHLVVKGIGVLIPPFIHVEGIN